MSGFSLLHRIAATLLVLQFLSCRNDYVGRMEMSPSGEYYLQSSVNRTGSSQPDYALVKLAVFDSGMNPVADINTQVCDAMSWSVFWLEGDTILLWSGDIGARAWAVQDRSVLTVPMTKYLEDRANWMKGP